MSKILRNSNVLPKEIGAQDYDSGVQELVKNMRNTMSKSSTVNKDVCQNTVTFYCSRNAMI